MARKQKVAIIGAGMGGLAAGIFLQRAGYEPVIFEQSEQLARIGAGINIYANGMKVLRAAGVAEHLSATGSIVDTWYSREWDTGRMLFSHPHEQWGERYGERLTILHRGDLQASLAAQLKPGTIRFSHHVVGIDELSDAIRLTFKDGSTTDVDVVIGADGVNSVVRELLLGPEAPTYSGFVAYRSIFPTSRLSRPLDSDACKFWSDERHPANEDRHFIIYYTTRAKDEVYFVTGSPDPDWEGQAPVEVTRKEVRDHYVGFHDEVQRVIDASISISKWPLLERAPLPLWSQGRIVLLGDACHPMKPHMGQGAGMAFEDAAVLVRCMQATKDDYPAAFKLYESTRKDRAAKVQQVSHDNTWLKYEEDPTWCFGYDATSCPLVPPTEDLAKRKLAA